MFHTISTRMILLGLAAGLVLTPPTVLLAQPPGPAGSTGADIGRDSGSGTGGPDTSSSRRGSQGFGTGATSPRGRSTGNPISGGSRSPNAGPGGGSHFPDDPSLVPFEAFQGAGPENPSEMATVPPALLREARTITDPGERSLSLSRLANAAIFSNELSEAHHALTEAARAAMLVQDPVIHDQRIIAVITSILNLAEANLREGKGDILVPEVAEALPAGKKVDRDVLIRRAEHEWKRAIHLAFKIYNPTLRSEYAFRVVDNESYGTQTLHRDYAQTRSKQNMKEPTDAYETIIARIIRNAATEAELIERPIWRDRALVETAVNAAGAHQFRLAVEIARRIPQPEVRTDALVRIAESEAIRGERPELATATYEEAARAVSSIPLDDPRSVLAGVLIDNLISVGRFEDARASVVLYSDIDSKIIALGAVAFSQGRRGTAKEAREWIARDVAPEYRPLLNRRVNEGIIEAIEQNRSRALDRSR